MSAATGGAAKALTAPVCSEVSTEPMFSTIGDSPRVSAALAEALSPEGSHSFWSRRSSRLRTGLADMM